MKADQVRNLYKYHFKINAKLWDEAVSQLTGDQFVQNLGYSLGSVRNQLVHMIDTDRRWFSGITGDEPPGFSNPVHFGKQPEKVRKYREETDAFMQAILAELNDETINAPYPGIPVKMDVWQALIHVVAHSIDHRAQTLAMLNQLGIETFPQDYALYLFGRI